MHSILLLIAVGFFAGLVDAIAGGGGLISLPAILAMGLPPQLALGTNKMVGISTAFASSSRYRWSGLVSWRELFPLAVLAFLLSMTGAWVATMMAPQVLRPVILVLLISAGLIVLFRGRFGKGESTPKYPFLVWFFVPAIGFYDGFFGPGTGTFLMFVFVLLAGNQLMKASAKSRVINLSTNLGALLWFASHGQVHFQFVWPAAVASFVGGLIGANLAVKKGVILIRPVFLVVTWGLILKVAFDFF